MAKKLSIVIAGLIMLAMMASGCGPSQEQIATMTAAAWTATPTITPTPTSTPTPTPIPYNLNVEVIDAEGNPISGSSVSIAELEGGSLATQQTDSAGMASWENLPGEATTISVSAQGYLPSELSQTIGRGINQITVTLERDPFGLLPSDACAPGETLVYIEDFQDGHAEGWPEVEAAVNLGASNGWSIVADDAGNLLLLASESSSLANEQLQPEGGIAFENAVWRLRIMLVDADVSMFLNWRMGEDSERNWRYIVDLGGGKMISLMRLEMPEPGHFNVKSTSTYLRYDRWYDMEISTYEGVTELWLDGTRLASYQDPQPLPPGTIGLEVNLNERSDASYFFDNLVVCELSAPFSSLFGSD